MTGHSPRCDRARLWASLAADGEISELEDAFLAAHVAACPACATYAAGLGGLVEAVRAAPPVEPARLLFRREAFRYSHRRALQVVATAAAVVAALGLGHLTASFTSPGGSSRPSRAAIAATQEPYFERSLLALLGRSSQRPRHGSMLPV
ncbi:MAG: zf-HC2 domain-containing protein [Gaiellaceae bacterium]